LNAEPPLAAYREAATTAKGMKKRVYFLPPAESVPSLETVL